MNSQPLIDACLQQDRKAQKALYDQYAPALYAVAIRYSRDQVVAQDVLQDSFLRIFRYLHQFHGECPIEYWMRKIVVSTALKQRSISWNQRVVLVDWEEQTNPGIEMDPLSQLSVEEIKKHIQNLPEGYRIVFTLYVIDGYSHAEIAELLQIEEVSSRSQLRKARQSLQRMLSPSKSTPI
ncbi:MAG: RNA polymerase sigma factor [Saprospiraceae bacterium]